MFDSVGTAANQINDLKSAIENKDYSKAAGIANDLSNQVIGRDNKLSDTFGTLSDVLTGKVQIRMGGLPGGMPGRTPGINPGVGGNGFSAPELQPTIVNGFGATAMAGQTALSMQPQVVEIPASSELELSSAEQVALVAGQEPVEEVKSALVGGWIG